MITYLESSAGAKLLIMEAESPALMNFLNAAANDGHTIVSSALLETELRRVAVRADLNQSLVTDILDRVDLVDPDRSTFTSAGVLPGRSMRSLDAIHLAAALRVNADVMVSYDRRQIEAAVSIGLRAISPGASA